MIVLHNLQLQSKFSIDLILPLKISKDLDSLNRGLR